MSINDAGINRRTAEDEEADVQQKENNWLGKSWKEWPSQLLYEGLDEHRGPADLTVKGSIPAWAAGSLFRTGPGMSTVEGTSRGTHHIEHWFDGIAHNHRFDITPSETGDGSARVTYRSRRRSDGMVAQIKKDGWQKSISYAQRVDPCVGIYSKFMSIFSPSRPNNNVAIIPNMPERNGLKSAGGHRADIENVYVTTDSATLEKLDPNTLEPVGTAHQSSLHPALKGPVSCAHAQRDPKTGDVFNYNLEFTFPRPVYRVFRVNAANGTTDILATISGPKYQAAYIHSFFLTENYVVLCIQSCHYAWAGLKIVWERNILNSIQPFDKTKLCRWVVVDRRNNKGLVAEFSSPAGFFFHSINAFEELVNDKEDQSHTDLCLDYIGYDDTNVMHHFYYDIVLDRNNATEEYMIDKQWYKASGQRFIRQRFTLPTLGSSPEQAASTVAHEDISIPSPHIGELPSINPTYAGRPYRYVYTTSSRGLSTFMDCLVKTDVQTREALIWGGPKGHSPSEPIFVQRPGAEDEDDGVVLSVVLDGTASVSYLLCLDARTMEELGRAEADFAIAVGLHGSHQANKAHIHTTD